MNTQLQYIKTAFSAEWMKIKNLGLLLMAIIFAVLLPILLFGAKIIYENARNYDGVMISTANFHVQETISSYGGFFLILFVIIAATRIAQTDHKNNGWTFLETQPLSKFSIYTGKFLVLAVLSFISITLFFIVTIILGYLVQIIFPQENLNFSLDFYWLFQSYLRLLVLSLGIVSLQMMLSVIIPSFIWPFAIGFVGFVGNVVGTVRRETYDFSPYNYIDTSLKYTDSYELNGFFNYTEYLSLFWAVLFFVIGYIWYSRRGFKNGFAKNFKSLSMTVLGILIFAGAYFFITKPIYPQKNPAITIVEGKITAPEDIKKIQIISEELKEPIAEIPVKNGVFRWESKGNIDLAQYILILDKKQYPFILSKGDRLSFDIKTDAKHLDIILKGTRSAENQYVINKSQKNSSFYSYIVPEKEYTNEPENFYKEAQSEWEDGEKFLNKYRTKENIHLASDFQDFQKQKNAVNMLNAIYDYQKMTSFNDKKFAPPKDLMIQLNNLVKKPLPMVMATQEFKAYKIKQLLPKEGVKNADSLVFVKLSQMPKSLEKDQLLTYQMLKMMNLVKDENQRNLLFKNKISEFQNPKYTMYLGNQLQVINNQQKGKIFPNIQFEDESGKKVNLSKFKGKYVVIDYWATWCGPCRETSPLFEYQAEQYKYNDNIVFLSASIDADKNKWKLDIKNKKSAVTQWWISDSKILNSLGVNGIPRFMIIDPEGKIYNADLPRPDETNFTNILDEVSGNNRRFVVF